MADVNASVETWADAGTSASRGTSCCAFLLDMNPLFESFLARPVTDALAPLAAARSPAVVGARPGVGRVDPGPGCAVEAELSVVRRVGSGRIEVETVYLKRNRAFAEEAPREELRGRLNAIGGISLPPEAVDGRRSFRLADLPDDAALEEVPRLCDWVLDEADPWQDHGVTVMIAVMPAG